MEIAQAPTVPPSNSTTTMKRVQEFVFAKCECCGLTEECTEEYAKKVREGYSGHWICGLCAEAVKDELVRSKKRIEKEEALNRHMIFCKKFKALSPPKNPTEKLISAVKHLILRGLDSPARSTMKPVLIPSQTCFSSALNHHA